MQNTMTKIERYGWEMKDEPGEMVLLDKRSLVVDSEYQRQASDAKVVGIAKKWSWLAMGAIIVVFRDGCNYVVDGQHRVMAAMRRSDISMLPCVRFASNGIKTEAQGFIDANTMRKPISALDKFRALVMTDDKSALFLERLLTQYGRRLSHGGGPASVSCVSLLLRLAKQNEQALSSTFSIVSKICFGKPIHERLIDSLFYIETHLPHGESVASGKWAERIIKAGSESLLEGAGKASAFYARGGSKVWAAGMLEAINKGARNRLQLLDRE